MSVVDPRFAAELHRCREAAGLSQRQLALTAHCSHTYVSDLERGTKRPTGQMARHLDEALDAGGTLAALVHDTSLDSPDDDDRMAAAANNPHRLDMTVVHSLDQTLRGLRALDDTVGAVAVLPAVTAQLAVVTALTTEAAGDVRPAIVSVAQQWAQFAGWLHTTGGNWVEAKAWFGRALELAAEVDDRDMTATVLSYQGHVAWLRGQSGPVVGLSRAARRDPTVYIGQRAYDAYQEARALAAVGDAPAATTVLAEADDLADESAAYTGSRPAWQYYRAPWFFRLERGLVLRYLARRGKARAADAVAELAAGVAGIPSEWRCAEWVAEYMCHLAAAHAQDSDAGSAREVLVEARRIAEVTRSARVLAMCAAVARRV